MQAAKKLVVVIVGYKSKKYLEESFGSLKKSAYQADMVIFVDNNSEDGSPELVKEQFPFVTIIDNPENSGFAGGNNIGIKRALEVGADFIFLMNPDTRLEPNCLGELMDHANENTVLQPLILLADSKEKKLLNTSGGTLSYVGFSYCSDYQKPAAEMLGKSDIALASGAAVLFPAPVLQKIGLFEESFYLYHEDVDLAWRAHLAGFTIALVPDALIWHHYAFSRNMKKMFWVERNRLLFMLRTYEIKTLILIAPIVLLTELSMLIYSVKTGWFKYKISSYGSLFSLLSITLKARQKIQKERVKSDHQLVHFMAVEVGFNEVKEPALDLYNKIITFYWWMVRRFI